MIMPDSFCRIDKVKGKAKPPATAPAAVSFLDPETKNHGSTEAVCPWFSELAEVFFTPANPDPEQTA